jgi:putative tryptophan/tyrosine transport system substrate-binding protein
MQRRDFITLLGGAAAWPLAARAQQPALPVVGYLNAGTADRFPANERAFHEGLAEAGFVEGKNVAIDYRSAGGQFGRLPALAAELVRRPVGVIAAVGSSQSALAAMAETHTIPIVFTVAGNPIELGLVASLNRPGGNLTGASNLSAELVPKKLELLHEVVPAASTIAVLRNPTSRNAGRLPEDLQAAADALGLKLRAVQAGSDSELETAFAGLTQLRPIALVILPDALFLDRRAQLGALALRYTIPAIYTYREFAAAGGLMSYGGSLTDSFHTVGVYTGRILKGAKPADLPVQQQTKVELIVNLKTAKALGLTVPLALLTRADEVIE